MQTQTKQKELTYTYKMSRLDEYRLWAMICDNELNADLRAKSQSLAFMTSAQANGGNDILLARRSRVAN